ncbi:arginine-tRNA-protein transferase [Thelonectria olida]|uniref:arginyltransferase n=1 Tax=Thelonectria olida TaxID=1576542 RepID=A0A9P8WDF1_9HYPO|nr:arginine-tRNA-protein transferase [Thelonectria olida]
MYRPNGRESCCPHYTIRLDSQQFKPSRAQRQTVNRFNKYVIGDSYTKEAARLHPKSREQAKKRDNQFDLVERIHEAEYSQLLQPPEPAHKLEVTLELNDFTEEKFAVYENYQRVVHHDEPGEISKRGFKRFLCDSPLRRETMVMPDGRERQLGSYHQCYRLDGKLVAIGVLDLLPECVSSVYFLYDESIHTYAPGKLGAFQEIALAMEEGYRWWYAGYYIHGCPKMRYKMDYSPQFILDPVALNWDPLDREVLDLLDRKPFVSLAEERQTGSVDTAAKSVSEDASMAADANMDGLALEAEAQSGDSDEESEFLFNSKTPGISSLSEIRALNMDHVAIKVAPVGPLFETCHLVGWEDRQVDDFPGSKAAIAELVAAIGPDLMGQICIDLLSMR